MPFGNCPEQERAPERADTGDSGRVSDSGKGWEEPPPYHQNAFVGQQQLWYRGIFMETEAVSLNTVLEYVEKLDIEDQQYLQEIIHRRLIDAKRTAIASRAKQAKANVQKNKSRSGTAKDLLADLNG
jgi:hypothetical protein